MNEDNYIASKPNLDVFFDDQLIGQISTNDGVNIQFTYLESWLKNETSFPISISIPLTADSVEDKPQTIFSSTCCLRKRSENELVKS